MRRSTTVELRTNEVAAAVGGRLVGPDIPLTGVVVGARLERGGELVVGVVAARDGHDFVPAAVSAGAAAVLVSRPARSVVPSGDVPAVEVDDTMSALAALGAHARQRLDATVDGRVVGITG